jgi:hypothetical protein
MGSTRSSVLCYVTPILSFLVLICVFWPSSWSAKIRGANDVVEAAQGPVFDVSRGESVRSLLAGEPVDWRVTDSSICVGYFGNGFTEFTRLTAQDDRLWCRRNPGTRAHYCRVHNLRIQPGLISMARGGERLAEVCKTPSSSR